MRKRKFTPGIEIMGLRLAPSGAMPMDAPEPIDDVVSSPGNTQLPIITPPNDDVFNANIPPIFYMDVATTTD